MALLPHLRLGLASKQTAPKASVIVLVIAAFLPDLLGLIFYLFQLENNLMVGLSHSLVMTVIWALVFGSFIFLIYRNVGSGIVTGILILNHQIIDFITWPMSAIFPNSQGIPVFIDPSVRVGLGLYKSIIGILIFEVGLFLLGIILFIKNKSLGKGKNLIISK